MKIGSRLRKILIGCISTLVAFVTFAYLLGPGLIRDQINERAGAKLGRKIAVGAISVNPFKLSARIHDVTIYELDGRSVAIHVDMLAARGSLASLVHIAPVVSRLEVFGPTINIVRTANDQLNFSDVLLKFGTSTGPGPHYAINDIFVHDGAVHLDDQVSHSRHDVTAIEISVPFLSNLPHDIDTDVEPAFSAIVDGSKIEIHGKSKPFEASRESTIDFSLSAIDVPRYAPFLGGLATLRADSGKLSGNITVDFKQATSSGPHLGIAGTLALTDLKLTNGPGGKPLALERVVVQARDVDVFGRNYDITRIQIDGLRASLIRDHDGHLQLVPPGLASTTARTATASSSESQNPTFYVGTIALRDARIGITDNLPARPFQLDLDRVAAEISGLSSGANAVEHVKLDIVSGRQLMSANGEFSLAKKSFHIALLGVGLDLAVFAPSLPPLGAAKIEQGAMATQATIEGAFGDGPPTLKVSEGSIDVNDLRMGIPGDATPVLALEHFAASGIAFDLASRHASASSILITAPAVNVSRHADASINLLGASPQAGGPAGGSPAPARAGGAAFTFTMDEIALERGALVLHDALIAGAAPIRLDKISLKATHISTDGSKSIPLELAATLNRSGTLNFVGNVQAGPPRVIGTLSTHLLDLGVIGPYLPSSVNVTLTHALLTSRGAINVVVHPPYRFTYNGAATLSDVATADKITSEEFVTWKTLSIPRVAVQVPATTAPYSVVLGDVAVSGLYARLIVNKTGRLNFQDVIAAPGAAPVSVTAPAVEPAPAPDPASPAPDATHSPVVRIGRVSFDQSTIGITDNFVQPNYSATLTDLVGSSSAVASDNPAPADISLAGKIDGDGSLIVSGRVNPLQKPLFLQIEAEAKNIELARMTPYAVKYAGYKIEKGKLSTKLKYHIENNALDAQNDLKVDQLTFGERVDSPTATSLPVLLAVKLLKDPQGQINISLPVSGSLSDPHFSVGGVIIHIIVNLLETAITAPFRLFASAADENTDGIGSIDFPAGAATLDDAQKVKLDKIGALMAKRSDIALDITGRADPQADFAGARTERLQARIKSQKTRAMKKDGLAADTDAVTVTAAEYPKYLALVYKDSDVAKPKNFIGLTKDIPPADMEALLLAHTPVTDDDLLQIAYQRSVAVRDYLEQSSKIDADRIFLTSPKMLPKTAPGAAAPAASGVDFAVR